MRRLTFIFFFVLFIQWTAFYVYANSDANPKIGANIAETAWIVFRILIFPIYDIFFIQQINNIVLMLLGYAFNALIQSILIWAAITWVEKKLRQRKLERNNIR